MTDTSRTRPTRSNRLERSREDRILTGVSGGLGRHLGINAWWFRFAFLILTFFGGFGLLVYVAAWLVIPAEGDEDPLISQWLGRLDTTDGGTIFGLILVGAAAIIILTQFANVSGTLIVALVLFVVGLMLFRGDLSPKRADVDPSEPEGSPDRGDTMEDTPDTSDSLAPAVVAPEYELHEPAPPTPPPPPPPPRERSMLGRITIAVGLIVIASMALVDVAFDDVTIEPVHYLGVSVAILGLGLLVGTWLGRARWLILVGILLLPALWFTSLWPTDWDWSAGEIRYEPDTAAEVETDYEQGFGQLTLDLSNLSPEELAEVGEIKASLGFGEMIVRLPDDVGATIYAEVGMGAVEGPFDDAAGIGIDVVRRVGEDPDMLILDLEVGAGVINVTGDAGVFSYDDGSVVVIDTIEWSNS